MLLKDIVNKSYASQLIEVANKEKYFFGYIKMIPEELLDYEVDYIAAGPSDSTRQPNVLLIDAHKI